MIFYMLMDNKHIYKNNMTDFWDVTQYGVVSQYQSFT